VFPSQATKRIDKKKLIAIVAAAAVYLFFAFICPVPEGLERPAIAAVGILFCCVVLWVAEVIPFIISVLLILVLLPFSNVIPLSDVYGAAMTPVIFFCLFVFALSAAVMSTPIPYRFANIVLKWCKTSTSKLILGLTMATSVLSMFVSDLASAAIFIGIALTIVKANGGEKGKSELAKALTIACACGAAIGGIGTPIGNSLNILSITMVEQFMGVRVTFVDWCVMGIPLALVASALTALWISKVFKCEPITEEAIRTVSEQTAGFGKLSTKEIKLIVWFAIVFGLMIATTWVTSLNMMMISFVAAVVAFIPGVDLLTKEDYYKNIGWDVILMISGVQALSTGIVGTGVAAWFVTTVLFGASTWPLLLVVFVMCVITAFLHICIPVGPPTVSVALPLIMALAATTGVNGAVIAMIGGILGGVTTVIPIDAIMMVCYSKGWITMGNWLKKGWFSTACLVILCTFYLPAVSALLGF
jgi:sodium-dependent dicarboxylate transporter 2/3/5